MNDLSLSSLSKPEELPENPRPLELRTILLAGIFIILFLAAIHEIRVIAMPVVLAFVLKLVLQPVQRFLEKVRFPRVIAALVILALLTSMVVMLGSALATPAAIWAEKLPAALPQLQSRLGFISKPLETAQKLMLHAEKMTQVDGSKVMPVVVEGNRLYDRVFADTQMMASGLFTTMLVLFFLLASGDTFLRRLVEVLPRFKDKRQVVDISQHIERDISAYLLTITVMNAGVGVTTGLLMMVCGMGDPMLWGAVAFLLNYMPIIGPMIGGVIFLLAGMLAFGTLGSALLPAALYLIIHIIEGTLLTPMVLAKRFTLNPVLIILALMFWYWMWGIPGIILAMPMLAVTKIICDRIQVLQPFGHFLAG